MAEKLASPTVDSLPAIQATGLSANQMDTGIVYDAEALPENPTPILRQVFHDVEPLAIDFAQNWMDNFATQLAELGQHTGRKYGLQMVRSAAARFALPNPGINRVRRTFAGVYDRDRLDPKAAAQAARLGLGCHDADFKYSRTSPEGKITLDDPGKSIAFASGRFDPQDEQLTEQAIFLAAAAAIDKADKVTESVDCSVLPLNNGRYGLQYDYIDPETDKAFAVSVTYGRYGKNPTVRGGEISISFHGTPVFVMHMSPFSGLSDNRAGDHVSDKSQVGIAMTAADGVAYFSDEDLRRVANVLQRPDVFRIETVDDSNIGNELQRAIRALRASCFYPGNDQDFYRQSFDQDSWHHLRTIMDKARIYYSTHEMPDYLKNALTDELGVMMEASPYRTLRISVFTGLLRILPFFSHAPPNFEVELLSNSAMYKYDEATGTISPRYRRDWESFGRQEKQWLESGYLGDGFDRAYNVRMASQRSPQQNAVEQEKYWEDSGYSGLKLFLDSLLRRSRNNDKLSPDDFNLLFGNNGFLTFDCTERYYNVRVSPLDSMAATLKTIGDKSKMMRSFLRLRPGDTKDVLLGRLTDNLMVLFSAGENSCINLEVLCQNVGIKLAEATKFFYPSGILLPIASDHPELCTFNAAKSMEVVLPRQTPVRIGHFSQTIQADISTTCQQALASSQNIPEALGAMIKANRWNLSELIRQNERQLLAYVQAHRPTQESALFFPLTIEEIAEALTGQVKKPPSLPPYIEDICHAIVIKEQQMREAPLTQYLSRNKKTIRSLLEERTAALYSMRQMPGGLICWPLTQDEVLTALIEDIRRIRHYG